MEVVHDDLYFADVRNRLCVCLVPPKETCPTALAATSNEGKKLLGEPFGITECSHPRDACGELDAMAAQFRNKVFDSREWLPVGQAIQ